MLNALLNNIAAMGPYQWAFSVLVVSGFFFVFLLCLAAPVREMFPRDVLGLGRRRSRYARRARRW